MTSASSARPRIPLTTSSSDSIRRAFCSHSTHVPNDPASRLGSTSMAAPAAIREAPERMSIEHSFPTPSATYSGSATVSLYHGPVNKWWILGVVVLAARSGSANTLRAHPRRIGWWILPVFVLAACGGGSKQAATTTTSTTAASTSLGTISVQLAITDQPPMALLRQNDAAGSACGIGQDVRFLAIASAGTVNVTDQSGTKIGLGKIGAGILPANAVVRDTGGNVVAQRCDFKFAIDISGRPTFMTFEFAWDNVAEHISVDATASDISAGTLKLTKTL